MHPYCKRRSIITVKPQLSTKSFLLSQDTSQAAGPMVQAWALLLAAAPVAREVEGYRYDLVDVGMCVCARM